MSSVVISGNTSGTITLDAPAVAGTTTLTLPATTGTVLTNASQLVGTGTTTNDSAAAGYVGEYVSSTVASPGTSLAVSGTVYNVTSISLTAGDWDVSGIVFYDSATGTVNVAFAQSGISLVSATQSATFIPFSQTYNSTIASIAYASQLTGTWRVSLSATTTVYLLARAGYSVQTPFAFGTLRARRVR
jgi:hypothetical protein